MNRVTSQLWNPIEPVRQVLACAGPPTNCGAPWSKINDSSGENECKLPQQMQNSENPTLSNELKTFLHRVKFRVPCYPIGAMSPLLGQKERSSKTAGLE